ncbi:MAG: fibronectin type III domain-containing protein [Clostridia bacterium]|nr:fibronectin type III domain-containing protein [Clostridia bacterium]
MKRKMILLSFIFVAVIGFSAFSLSKAEMRKYEESGTLKIKDGVVYALDEEKKAYYVKDYFATDELAENATEIVIAGEIDGVPVKAVSPDYLFNESYPGVDLITVGEGVEYIGEKAFSALDGVKKIRLPETVTEIGKGAFSEMESLTEVTLPSAVTVISDDMFLSCPRLLTVNIGGKITSVGAYAFAGCHRLASFEIPESINFIGEAAFRSAGLINLYIPAGVSFSGDRRMYSCFKGCTSLKRVEFENRKDESFVVNEYFFSGCSALEEVVLPDAKEIIICEGAFENCEDLKTLTNTERITGIGSRAFYNCGFEKMFLPADILFENKESGDASVSVFENCHKLKTVIFETREKTENFILPEKMFKDCTVLSRVMLPLTEGEIIISAGAFDGCNAFLGAYNTAPVSFIGEGAFSGCSSLEVFVLPEKVTVLPDNAFDGCRRLINVYLHENITEIGKGAFNKCEKLTDIYYEGTAEQYAALKKSGMGQHKSKVRPDSSYYPLLRNVKAETSHTRARLIWDEDSKADGYRVYTIDGTLLKKEADITATEYTFTGLTPGQEYSFSVRSYYMEKGKKVLGPQKEIVTVTAE